MSKLSEIIRDKSIESIIGKLLFLLWVFIVPALVWFRDSALSVLQYISKELLLISSLVLLSLLLIAISFIIHLRKKLRNDLYRALGVYWDNQLNTYCPSCKDLLTNYAFYETSLKHEPGYRCIHCNATIHMSDGSKCFLSYEEAVNIIKEKKLFIIKNK